MVNGNKKLTIILDGMIAMLANPTPDNIRGVREGLIEFRKDTHPDIYVRGYKKWRKP